MNARYLLLSGTLALLLLVPSGARLTAQDPSPDDVQKQWAEQQYAKFVTDLDSQDPIVRARGAEALGRLGLAQGAPVLARRSLAEGRAYLARLMAGAAVRLDRDGTLSLARELVGANKSASGTIRRNLVILLRECGGEEAGTLILEEFRDTGQKEVLLEVLRAVGRLKLSAGASLLKHCLGQKDTDIRNAAAIAAGRLGSGELAPSLLGALDAADGFHGKFAAWALGRLDDPDVFSQVQGRLGSASGESGEAKAKALEATARREDEEDLVGILAGSKSREYREAAAIALGRLGTRSSDAHEVLFNRMLRDPERVVRGACWHALSRVANEELVPLILKRQNQRDSELAKYVFHLMGDLRIAEGAHQLMKVMINERRDVMLRHAAAINFWRAADDQTVRELELKIEESSGQFLLRGLEAAGFRKSPDGFRFLLRMLKVLRDGSEEEYVCEKALERMTGHFFGPDPGIWKKWFEKNPEFFTPKQAELERNKWREDFDKENEGFRQTEETEYAVQLGLDWLARHQHPDGRFDPQRFYEMCGEEPPCKREGARVDSEPCGFTSLAVLAYLGAGYSPDEGKYKDVIRNALDYLSARQLANGDFLTNDLLGGYTRPVGAQAFAEAYMICGDPDYAWQAQKAMDFLTTIQNKLGAWRYRVVIETTDTSCMSWNLFAFKTGQKAGLSVREIALAGCYNVMEMYSNPVVEHREDFIDIDPAYGYEVGRDTKYQYETGYQNDRWDTKYATVPLGIMCRIFLGWRRSHPFCIGSANKVLADMMEEIPRGENWSLYRSQREYPTYAWYYGTLAMHQMGGRYFREWNERIKKVVPGTQYTEGCERGSWPCWNHDGFFGRLYTTAMAVLTLETYYRYLPVLQD